MMRMVACLAARTAMLGFVCISAERVRPGRHSLAQTLERAPAEAAVLAALEAAPETKVPHGFRKGDEADREAADDDEQEEAGPDQAEAKPVAGKHYWSRRGGNLRMSSDVPWTAPTNLSQGPSWNWSNPLGEQVRHSPLIDSNKDIYIATSTRIRKFNWRTGALFWTWESPTAEDGLSEMVACPELYGDSILVVLAGPASVVAYSLSLAMGAVNWRREHAVVQNLDASAMLAQNGSLVFAVTDENSKVEGEGNTKLLAVSTSDGGYLWDFTADGVVWNFSPASPGDGTLLFSTSCGVAYRLDFEGRLLWKGEGQESGHMCSAGGGALGPDGVFYISWGHQHSPGNSFAALRVRDGVVLWNKTTGFANNTGAAQYPAVGRLGKDGPLAVVVAVGDQPLLQGLPGSDYPLRNAVVAMDAATGDELWRSEDVPWPHTAAAGDELRNVIPRLSQPRLGPICLPDIQGIPAISGDGTVYASSSHHGDLRAIRDSLNRDLNLRTAATVSTFHPGNCFLNSPSLAPGLLVAAPCWGPTYVFVDAE